MKEYLQLEGVAYKLVPIKTPVDPRNPYDMGRINTDKMYDIVMNWDWGNMGSDDIYHDPETRRNSITYRSNLARLVENLLNEQDTTRAKKVLDLAMENMPVEHYNYYALLEPYVTGYYEVGEPEKAREIWEKIATHYKENLAFYSSWDIDRQYRYFNEIVSNIERYRALVDLLVVHQDEEMLEEKADEFNEHLEMFRHFYGEEEEITPAEPEETLIEEGMNPELNGGNNSLRIDSSE
jgi:tetratricopeptide (TPR) repeat protein